MPAEVLQGRGVGEEYTVDALRGLASAGILPFSPVVAPEGLVGMVQERRSDDEHRDRRGRIPTFA